MHGTIALLEMFVVVQMLNEENPFSFIKPKY